MPGIIDLPKFNYEDLEEIEAGAAPRHDELMITEKSYAN